MDTQPIVVERIFNVPASRAWEAITRKDEMKKWYFDLAEFNAVQGFQFQFTGGQTPERQYLHLCEIVEVIPEKKLSYSWRYDGYPGNTMVIFELNTQNDKTLLRLTHEGIETFPNDNPDLAIGNFTTGWNSIINIALKEYLEKVQ
jgi:uncharacterized protein YndB with AHSA1/START domain